MDHDTHILELASCRLASCVSCSLLRFEDFWSNEDSVNQRSFNISILVLEEGMRSTVETRLNQSKSATTLAVASRSVG